MRSILWVLVLVGCGSESAPTPAPAPIQPTPVATAPACESTIADAAKRIATESRRVGLDAMAERIKLTMTASCESEKWPAHVMTCISAARLDVDLTACTEQLTHEQYARLQRKIVQLAIATQPPAPDPAPKVTPPAAPRPTIAQRPQRNPTDFDRDGLKNPFDSRPAQLDCTSAIRDVNSAKCRAQYCKAHPADARCDIE